MVLFCSGKTFGDEEGVDESLGQCTKLGFAFQKPRKKTLLVRPKIKKHQKSKTRQDLPTTGAFGKPKVIAKPRESNCR